MTKRKEMRTMGINQLRMLIAASEAPLQGLITGPRPAVDFVNMKVPWFHTKQRPATSENLGCRTSRASQALAPLVKKGYLNKIKTDEGKAWLRVDHHLTKAGKAALDRQRSGPMQEAHMKERRKALAKKGQSRLNWRISVDPTLVWPRFYAEKFGWRVLLERSPTAGHEDKSGITHPAWQFMLINNDGENTDWLLADKQSYKDEIQHNEEWYEKKAKRECEATFYSCYAQFNPDSAHMPRD